MLGDYTWFYITILTRHPTQEPNNAKKIAKLRDHTLHNFGTDFHARKLGLLTFELATSQIKHDQLPECLQKLSYYGLQHAEGSCLTLKNKLKNPCQ